MDRKLGMERWLAAKSDPGGSLWLPLWMHARDTAAIMEKLVQKRLPGATADAIGLEAEQLVRTARFLGAVHDIGKATCLFQNRILKTLPDARLRTESWLACRWFPNPNQSPHARAGEAILLELGCCPELASVVGAHHGQPQDSAPIRQQMTLYPQNFWGKSDEEPRWRSIWQTMLEHALAWSGFGSVEELPAVSIPAQLLLCGLLIMADWIASNTAYFPLIPVEASGEEPLYPQRPQQAWRRLSLTVPWESASMGMDADGFRERFGFPPNEMQQAVLRAAGEMDAPGLLILEAGMGSGKTEAALAAAEVFAGRFQEGGLYFGLPTQATANGIFGRLLSWAETQSEELPHAIRLAHGMAELNEDYQALFPGDGGQGPEEAGNVLAHEWFRGNKQALLADFVIGTVDQLLMAALRQKHLMLRHLGLAGKVVVVDEVHACDAYMNVYLERALAWLGRYQTPVILLSATLPAARRAALIGAYLGAEELPAGWEQSRDYPLITWTQDGKVRQTMVPVLSRRQEIALTAAGEETLAQTLRNALAGGGCAGVIVNTVRKAQAVADELRRALPEWEVLLVHAQFLMPDRAEKEQELLRRLGKRSAPQERDRLIVVGTQVLEQSLDIDFDFLATELCPMDLLLQRIGRLHRHAGRVRPAGLEQPRCVVLTGAEGAPDPGSEAVYGAWLLRRTRELLPVRLLLPDDIPALVQDAYGWEEDDPLPETAESQAEKEAYLHLQKTKQQKAESYTIRPPEGRSLFPQRNVLDGWMQADGAATDQAARAAVRDGDLPLEVLVMMRRADGTVCFLPWREAGQAVAADRPPSREESLKIARQRLRLPGVFSRGWRIDAAITELEEQNKTLLPEWQTAPMLRGELVLLLDETLRAPLAGMELEYSREDGLTCRKEETEDEGNRV